MSTVPYEVSIAEESTSISSEKKKKSKKEKKDKKEKKEKKEKKSGVRTKFLLESLRQDYYSLQDENNTLREIIRTKLPIVADVILAECCPPRMKVSSIDELGAMMPAMTIEEGEEEEDEDDEDDEDDE
jgi:hypothetical protein